MFFKFSDVFGCVWTHSDPFGPVRMCSDAFGNKWRVSEKSDFFEIVGDIFGRFQMALRVSWSVSNVMLSFDRFWDVLDEISYLLSLVIYREPLLALNKLLPTINEDFCCGGLRSPRPTKSCWGASPRQTPPQI